MAAYGRERMPSGGRLKIELGTIVVDRHFTDKHPNVSLGPHALVTVTESRRTTQTGGLLQVADTKADWTPSERGRPGERRSRDPAGARRRVRRASVDDGRAARGHGRQDQPAAPDLVWRASATHIRFQRQLVARLAEAEPPSGRGIPAGGVAPPSNTPGILGRRALPSGRRAPESGPASAKTGHWRGSYSKSSCCPLRKVKPAYPNRETRTRIKNVL